MKFSKTYEPNQYEPDIYAMWEKSKAFSPRQTPQSSPQTPQSTLSDPFTIVMPPPNANGNLHIGHALTVGLEDILTRYHRLKGHDSWYIPGADHAGFETWVVYERHLEEQGKTRFDYDRDTLYDQVWDFVHRQRGNMELQLRALGASCDWDSLTFTLDDKVVDRVYKTFKKLWDDGLIYRGKKLVNFCPKHQTAFADIEVTYTTEAGTLWRIAYPLKKPTAGLSEIIISTTRPETLLGDTAVAVNPKDKRYNNIIGQYVKLPLTDREIPIIADEHADMTYGTGAVKITPAHDYDDYEVGARHHLEAITVIGFDGRMTSAAGANYEGLTVAECREKVLNNLDSQGLRRGEEHISHNVGRCYKCNTAIEPLLKEQWFVNVKPLAERAIQALKANRIRFYPKSKKTVLIHYLENLRDWNISRQIPWGIPIPAFVNADDPSDWIFDTRVKEQSITKNGKTYLRDNDTFDTWFSSGQWPFITTGYDPASANTASNAKTTTSATENTASNRYPTSVLETGADILFQWVGRMIMLGLYITGDVPFREVYLHGLILDEKGRKMSKSKGNVINPIELVSQYGSDALRLGLVTSRSAGINQAFSVNNVVAGRNLCNKLWNVSRFIQRLVDESATAKRPAVTETTENAENAEAPTVKAPTVKTPTADAPTAEAPTPAPVVLRNNGEDWICREINRTAKALDKLLADYRFAEASAMLHDLVWDKYADWFLEAEKLWKNLPLLQDSLEKILILLHPFAPFVTETIWQNLSWTDGMLIAQTYPEPYKIHPARASQFEELIQIVSNIRSHFQAIPDAGRYPVAFFDDQLIYENQLLIQHLTKAAGIPLIDAKDKTGLHLAVPGHDNLYLEIPDDLKNRYIDDLKNRIIKCEHEFDTLAKRLHNENYLKKAPSALVDESKAQLAEKDRLLTTLRAELKTLH